MRPTRQTVSTKPAEKAHRLTELPLWSVGVVDTVGGTTDLRRRLLEMGFCNKASVTAIRRAPLGDPVEFRLRGYNVSLRREEAQCILVVPAAPDEDAVAVESKE
jgi:ferrous iron transport protein A